MRCYDTDGRGSVREEENESGQPGVFVCVQNWSEQLYWQLNISTYITHVPFSGFSVGFCTNEEEKGYLLPTIARKITLPTFRLNAPVVIRAKLSSEL